MSEAQTPPPVTTPPPASSEQDSRNLAMLAHILNFTFLAPLLIYLLKKDSSQFLEDQSKEALNFSLCCLIVHVVCGFARMLCIPALISLALLITQIILGIMGGLKARDGVAYRYPLNFQLLK